MSSSSSSYHNLLFSKKMWGENSQSIVPLLGLTPWVIPVVLEYRGNVLFHRLFKPKQGDPHLDGNGASPCFGIWVIDAPHNKDISLVFKAYHLCLKELSPVEARSIQIFASHFLQEQQVVVTRRRFGKLPRKLTGCHHYRRTFTRSIVYHWSSGAGKPCIQKHRSIELRAEKQGLH